MRKVSKAFIFGVASQLVLAALLFTSHAQQQAAKPATRGDFLADKLKAIEKDLATAFDELKQKADNGDAAAADRASRLLIYGQGTEVDLKAAFSWAEKSAKTGHGLGQYHLGLMYRHGTGTDPDEKKSNEMFALAVKTLPALVDKKNTEAMRALATLHYRGWGGLEQNRGDALKLHQQAADLGDPFALVEVADQLWDGKGTHRQRTKARRLYQQGLPQLMALGEKGGRRAQYIVGNLLGGLRLGARDFEESIKWHQPGALAGYASGQFIIGARHQKGHGTAVNDVEAMIWYNKAAAQGHPGAINNVGWMHGMNRAGGKARDDAKASAMYLAAAERGNEVSQNNIAMRFSSGSGVAADPIKAFDWHKRSAENDYGRGQYYLGLCYEVGKGTDLDLPKAIYWFKRAGENDLVDAQNKLATIYRDGKGVERDLVESLAWLARVTEFERDKVNPFLSRERYTAQQAAKQYVPLKKYLDEGWPRSPRDLGEVQPEAEQGKAEAQYELAALFALGIGGAGQSDRNAHNWAAKAAAQGHAGAAYFLGICHEEGRSAEQDSAKAKEWYGKAAAKDHAAAQNNLAVILEEEGKDTEAKALFTKAATTNANAAYNLARILEDAKEPDLKAAFLLYEKAAKAGHGQAQNNLGYLHQTGRGVEANLEEAARWYEHAANQGNLDGMFNFGLMTVKGQGGIQPDKVKTFVLWGRAAMGSHSAAVKHLAALANSLNAEETNRGRVEAQAWTANPSQRVLQYYVVRQGD